MFNALCLLAIAALLLTSFALLALTQERHWESVFEAVLESNRPFPHTRRLQRAIYLIAICCALPLSIAQEGAGFGSLLWVLMVCASAAAVAFTLTVWPAMLRPLARTVARADRSTHP